TEAKKKERWRRRRGSCISAREEEKSDNGGRRRTTTPRAAISSQESTNWRGCVVDFGSGSKNRKPKIHRRMFRRRPFINWKEAVRLEL
ncbi:hypothetical protein PIB30_112995, partial [Stylosanthes scabra]|nr:hypothetical protein [Stylosanthes scabra]